jgi:MFS family permease
MVYFAVLGVANGAWLARIPAVKQQLGLSDGSLGLALLAAPAGLIVVIPLAGRLVHHFGSRIPTVAGGTCVVLLPVTMGLASSQAALMTGLFCFGLAGGLLDVGMNALAVQAERGLGRPVMTSFHACFSFGGLAGSLLGGLGAWAGVSPAVNFAAAGVPLVIVALLAGRWLPPGRPRPHGEQAAVAEARPAAPARPQTSRLLLVLALLAICALLGEGAADGWSAVYLRDNVHTSAAFAALGYAGFCVSMAIGRLSGDRLALRFGPAPLLRLCGVLAASGLAAAVVSRSPAIAIAGFAVFGAGLSCVFPLLLSAAGHADPLRSARGIARVAGLGYVGMLGGPVLIGGLAGRIGLPAALAVPAVLALAVTAGAGALAPAGRTARQQLTVSLAEEPAAGRDQLASSGRSPGTWRVGHDLGRLGQQRIGDLPDCGQAVGPGEQGPVTDQHIVDQPDVWRQYVSPLQAGERDRRTGLVELQARTGLLGDQRQVNLAIAGQLERQHVGIAGQLASQRPGRLAQDKAYSLA